MPSRPLADRWKTIVIAIEAPLTAEGMTMLELAYSLIAAGICLWSASTIWLAFFSPRRTVEPYDRRVACPEAAHHIATEPRPVLELKLRKVANKASDRAGIYVGSTRDYHTRARQS